MNDEKYIDMKNAEESVPVEDISIKKKKTNRKIKIVLSIILIALFIIAGIAVISEMACDGSDIPMGNNSAVDYKPVIYLYPESETAVNVKLTVNGELTCTYPKYPSDGWKVLAKPDGTLTDESGMEYNYLYWEALTNEEWDFSTGYCVAGEDTAKFLEITLEQLGLNRKEANEFIVYWLPQMEINEYNLISFQTDLYESHAKLDISPKPDNMIRVFMAWKPVDQMINIAPQVFPETINREGFTVVEWGGTKVNHGH